MTVERWKRTPLSLHSLPYSCQRIHGAMAQQRFHHLGPPAHMWRKPVLLLTESPKQTRLGESLRNSKIHGSALCLLNHVVYPKKKRKKTGHLANLVKSNSARIKEKIIHSSRLIFFLHANKKMASCPSL